MARGQAVAFSLTLVVLCCVCVSASENILGKKKLHIAGAPPSGYDFRAEALEGHAPDPHLMKWTNTEAYHEWIEKGYDHLVSKEQDIQEHPEAHLEELVQQARGAGENVPEDLTRPEESDSEFVPRVPGAEPSHDEKIDAMERDDRFDELKFKKEKPNWGWRRNPPPPPPPYAPLGPCGPNAQAYRCNNWYSCCRCINAFYEPNPTAKQGCRNIDDCALDRCEKALPSPRNSRCVDGNGSRTCLCNPGYGGNAEVKCVNVNDCVPFPCGANANCADKVGGYQCTCKSGFTGNANFGCSPVDDCYNNGQQVCGANTVCTDLVNDVKCTCEPGFTHPLNPDVPNGIACDPINECITIGGCGANTNCIDGHLTRTCVCKPGYEGDPMAGCTDINGCSPNQCGANSVCSDGPDLTGPNSYTCTCQAGFTGNARAGCVDIDDCFPNDPCGANTICTQPVPGAGPVCNCKTGYDVPHAPPANIGEDCIQNNECIPGACGPNTDCTDDPAPSSWTCACKPGYTGNAYDTTTGCTEINECLPNNPCGSFATCTDAINSFTCACQAGYGGNPYTGCTDIDECAANPCGTTGTKCTTPTLNSFTCECLPGYEGDPYSAGGCTDIDECAPANACGTSAICTQPAINEKKCECPTTPTVTTGNPYHPGACLPMQYCAGNPCAAQADCTEDTANNRFLCNCKPGFQGDPYVAGCVDIDECQSLAPCGPNTVCSTPSLNMYQCDCKNGYEGDPYKATNPGGCTDIDECLITPCGVFSSCLNLLNGIRFCSCIAGYTGNAEVGCVEIDECVTNPCGANTNCVDKLLGRDCTCKSGYEGDPEVGCTDIDECLLPGACGGNAICQDVGPNNHTCTCVPGFEGPAYTTGCTNIDDCWDPVFLQPTCGANTDCTDGIQSFTCECKTGFEGNPYDTVVGCTGIDDCLISPCGAFTSCADKHLGRDCTCLPGWEGDPNAGCTNIDDCDPFPCGPNTHCTDGNSTFTCECNLGFEGNPYNTVTGCIDTDECFLKKCDVNAKCTNTVGSFSCECNPGYGGSGLECDNRAGVLMLYSYLQTYEDGRTDSYTVRLTVQPSSPVTVHLNNTNEEEYTIDKTKLVFTPSDYSLPQSVVVTGLDDDIVDGDQSGLILSKIESADTYYVAIASLLKNVPVLNRDFGEQAGLWTNLNEALGPLGKTIPETRENGTFAEYELRLKSEPVADVTINVISMNPAEITPLNNSLTFTASNWNTFQTVTIQGVDDPTPDGDQDVILRHTFSAPGDAVYSSMWNKDIDCRNLDDDPPPIPFPVIYDVTPTIEAGGVVTITGQHFETNPTISVTIDGQVCLSPNLENPGTGTIVTCTAQKGSGSNLAVSITIGATANLKTWDNFFYIKVPGSLEFLPAIVPAERFIPIQITLKTSSGVKKGTTIEFTLPPGWRDGGVKFDKSIPPLGEAFVETAVTAAGGLQIVTQFTPTFDTKEVAPGELVSLFFKNVISQKTVGLMDKIEYFSYHSGIPQDGPVKSTNDVTVIAPPSGQASPTFGEIAQKNLRVFWSPPMDDGLSPVTEYKLYKNDFLLDTMDETVLNYEVTGLEPFTGYLFKVQAVNDAGDGEVSMPALVTTSYAKPNVTAVSPTSGPTAGGNVITFHGYWFTDFVASVKVLSVNSLDCSTSKKLVNAEEVHCTVPPAKSLNEISKGKGYLETSFGESTSPNEYTFYPKPAVYGVSPLSGPSGGGTIVTITGKNFGITANDVHAISFGYVPCQNVVFYNSTYVTCKTSPSPDRAEYMSSMRFQAVGGFATSAQEFHFMPAKITDFRPNGGPADGGTTVTIKGERFGSNPDDLIYVRLGGANCKTMRLIDMNTIECDVAAGQPKTTHVVEISTFYGGVASSFPLKYTYLDVETPSLPVDIRAIEPTLGPMIGGTNVTITGHWLGRSRADIKNITVAGGDCTETRWYQDDKTIGCITVAHPISSGDVKVLTYSQGDAAKPTSQATYEYHYPYPSIDFVKPKTVKRGGQQPVSLRGNWFGPVDGKNSRVSISGVPCLSTTWISETELVCNTPAYDDFPERVDMNALTVAVTIGQRKSNDADVGFAYGGEEFLECKPPCGWQGQCIKGTCVCNLGYAGEPECDLRSVIVSPVNGSTSEANQNEIARFTVVIEEHTTPRVGEKVVIQLESTNKKEGYVMPNATYMVFTNSNFTRPLLVPVIGVPDNERDGNVTFGINITVTRGAPEFKDGPPLPIVEIVNRESSPRLIGIEPTAIPIEGGRVTLKALHLDPHFVVNTDNATVRIVARDTKLVHASSLRLMQDGVTVDPMLNASNLTNTTDDYVQQEDILLEMPPHSKGYHKIEIMNQGGTYAMDPRLLYFTDECTEPGTYGTKTEGCLPCPKGAECPGGNRVWTKSGNWNPGESSGFSASCEPPLRCQGGRDEQCAHGYEGVMCGKCIRGYTDFNGLCKECPQDARLMQNVVAALIVWCSLGMIGMWIPEQTIYSYTVLFFKSVAILGAIGETANYQVPFLMLEIYNACFIFLGDIRFLRTDCKWDFPYSVNYGLARAYNTAVMTPMFLGIGITYFLKWWWHKTTRDRPDLEYLAEIKAFYKNRFIRSLIIWLSLIYFSVMSSSLATISCKKFPIGYYMIAYNAEKCYEGLGMQMMTLASVVCVFFLGLVFPISFLIFLKKRKHVMFTSKDFQDKFNVLYDFFKRRFWYLWFFDFIALGILSGGRSAFYDDPKLVMSMSCAVFALKFVIILWKQPYSQTFINATQGMMQVGYMCAVALNHIARSGELEIKPAKGNALIGLVMLFVGIPAALLLLFILYAIFFDLKFQEADDVYKELNDEDEDEMVDFSLDLDNIQVGSTDEYNEDDEDAGSEAPLWNTPEAITKNLSTYGEQGLATSLAALNNINEQVQEWGEDTMNKVLESDEYESEYESEESEAALAQRHFVMVNTEFDPEED
eukprot:TRINITY_DN2391_c0_g1_i1.p1 TRINITY_DN2391_c0_g1~~TRINITY_DN2391_c0_g1_i1.p1  ORF type:complete len:2926 (+),score=809.34 TRINITY_DN2391_c0_g1_i1:140-8917(+)